MNAPGGHRLLIAGGKTGGHLFPGIAIARKFLSLSEGNEALFIGTKSGMEARVLPREGLPVRMVASSGIRGLGIAGMIKGLALIPVTIAQAAMTVRSFKPHAAVGVGGFVSGPAIVAAWLLRIPTAIQEQNASPGWTNRILGWLVDVVFVSFEESKKYFPANKVIIAGNPVRENLFQTSNGSGDLRLDNLDKRRQTLFVLGGSQGARPVNRAILDFMRSNPVMRDRLNVIHQTGAADFDDVQREYREMGYNKALVAPFIHSMNDAYRTADLVVARAGAGTVFELMALGKPSVLIPFPQAAGDHQTVNAMSLASRGAAVMVRQSEIIDGALSRTLKELLASPEKIREIGEKARSMAKTEAAEIIARKLDEMASRKA